MQATQVTIRSIPHTQALENHILEKTHKLDQFYHRIHTCRVIIEQSKKHQHQGKLFNVKIDLTVPGKELVVNRKKSGDVYIAIRDAFNAIKRQLESYARKRRGDIKNHEIMLKGTVKRIFPKEGYGFIRSVDGTDYYFSIANMCNKSFDQLQVGDSVDFLPDIAQDGLQARRVIKNKSIEL